MLEKYGITEPRSVIDHLRRAADETPKPGDPRLANASTVMIATPQLSLEAAAEVARQAGVTPLILGDALEGEAREVGRVMAGIARQAALRGQPAPPPVVLLSGGETTVTVRGTWTRRTQCRVPARPSPSSWTACRACSRWPATRTAWTGPRRSPAPS